MYKVNIFADNKIFTCRYFFAKQNAKRFIQIFADDFDYEVLKLKRGEICGGWLWVNQHNHI